MTDRPAGRWWAVGAAVAVTALALLTWLVTSGMLPQRVVVPLVGASWLVFAGAVRLVLRAPRRTAIALILLGGVVLPVLAASAPPRSSDDLYRYVWDGRVQAAGVDPYAHPPADPALRGLRDGFLWPADAPWCLPDGTCTRINRPTVPTIYPPVAQAYFLGVHVLSPAGSRTRPVQLAAALIAAATALLLVRALPRFGLNPRWAALWAWCPTVFLEAGNNAHVDVLATFLAAAALTTLAGGGVLAGRSGRGRAVWGGVLLGLAVAVKLTPGLLAPALLRRRPVLVALAAAGTVVLGYLPHMWAVGADVLGYIPGYLTEEGYASGQRFALLTLVLPVVWAPVAAGVVLVAAAGWTALRADPDRPWDAAVTMVGTALLVATPGYSWYALLLVVLVALSGRGEWLAVAAAGHLALYAADLHLAPATGQRLGYGLALVAVIAVAVRRQTRRGSPRGAEGVGPGWSLRWPPPDQVSGVRANTPGKDRP
ncbi:glycosyltransferase family 87 protein [Longispora sp. NPDC051575]|uniref:glycosyltransferase family 87 protein n=1 Tax=Longispora sp. NPDC051575 TaxID=3154943 RepID=UPI0034318693